MSQGLFGVGARGTAAHSKSDSPISSSSAQRLSGLRLMSRRFGSSGAWRRPLSLRSSSGAVDRGPQCHDPGRQKRVSAALKGSAVELAAPVFQDEFGWLGVGLDRVVEAEVQRLVGEPGDVRQNANVWPRSSHRM